jgi:hypothetical protein
MVSNSAEGSTARIAASVLDEPTNLICYDPGVDWMLLIVPGLIVVTLVTAPWWVPRAMRREDAARRAVPRVAIHDLKPGTRARVVGIAHTMGQEVAAHLSGKPCFASRAHIDQSDVDGTQWLEDRIVPFKVVDYTGSVVVEISDATLDLTVEAIKLDKPGIGQHLLAKTVRSAYEGCLPVESHVAVTGYYVQHANGTFHLVGKPGDPVVISNHKAALAAE